MSISCCTGIKPQLRVVEQNRKYKSLNKIMALFRGRIERFKFVKCIKPQFNLFKITTSHLIVHITDILMYYESLFSIKDLPKTV